MVNNTENYGLRKLCTPKNCLEEQTTSTVNMEKKNTVTRCNLIF